MNRLRRACASFVAAGALLLAGCAGTVALDPAPDANDPLCAEVMVSLPDALADQERRWTDAQATAAWGDPSSVLLRCGVTPPGPTTLPCSEMDGVDWIIDEAEAPNYRFVTYGRTPAVEIYLDNRVIGSADVLRGVARGVQRLPTNAQCTDLSESTPVPAPTDDAD